MRELKELLSLCKASVTININEHRDYYQTVESYIEERQLTNKELKDEIGLDVYEKMKELNTIIEIQAYPDTPIGSYSVMHYDIDMAIFIMLECVKQSK